MDLTKLSALFAFVAAALWLWSAVVRTPHKFHIQVMQTDMARHVPSTGGVKYLGYGASSDLQELGLALRRQSRLSAAAAISAALSAVLQGAALVAQAA